MGEDTDGTDRFRAVMEEFIGDALRAADPGEVVDLEIEWPPSDELHLTAYTGWLDRAEGWAVADIVRIEVPREELGPGEVTLDAVFERLVTAREAVGGPAAVYARLHDSATSIDLTSGRRVWDHERPDWSPPPMKPFANGPGRPPVDDTDGETVKRGEAVATAKRRLGIPESTKPRVLGPVLQVLEEGDVRLSIRDGVVQSLTYLPSFTKKICGIWIGASPADVVAALGPPLVESVSGPNSSRAWTFKHRLDGSHIAVAFDEEDRVRCITR